MLKIILADDEPLVLIGLQGMIPWEQHNITLCGSAKNGEQALALIEQHRPDIVITDIKMPIKTGLEVCEEARKIYGELPVFIMLTSYEEISFLREAMRLSAVEYLIKLELTAQNLLNAVQKAVTRVQQIKQAHNIPQSAERAGITQFRDKLFVRAYNNLFDERASMEQQIADLAPELAYSHYTVATCVIADAAQGKTQTQLLTLYTSAVQMLKDNISREATCVITSLDMQHFNVLFCYENEKDALALPIIMKKGVQTIKSFFNADLTCGIGSICNDFYLISQSYRGAKTALLQGVQSGENVVVYHDEISEEQFSLQSYRKSLQRAFEELDTTALNDTITDILSKASTATYADAADVASSLLHMAITLLPDGEDTVNTIFEAHPSGYRSLYAQTTAEGCCKWAQDLCNGVCEILTARKQNYKERIVQSVQEYIKANLNKKLTLNEVAAAFSFSPNYLSQLFAKYCEGGFVGYITETKITIAKQLLTQTNKKIYEISDELGFENAFYFSKVFKKITGKSPRDYMQEQYK